MDIVHHICKSWPFKYWAKQHRLLDVRGIGVPLNVYIPKEGIRLEHQRLNDLVYVHYNLWLKNRYKCFLSCFELNSFIHNYMLFFFRFYNKKKNLWYHWLCMHWWDQFLDSWWRSTSRARCWRIGKSSIWRRVNSNKWSGRFKFSHWLVEYLNL